MATLRIDVLPTATIRTSSSQAMAET